MTGQTVDSNNVFHGFFRSSGGTVKSIDAPGAGTNEFQSTFASAINDTGEVTGYYFDSNGKAHGFLRTK